MYKFKIIYLILNQTWLAISCNSPVQSTNPSSRLCLVWRLIPEKWISRRKLKKNPSKFQDSNEHTTSFKNASENTDVKLKLSFIKKYIVDFPSYNLLSKAAGQFGQNMQLKNARCPLNSCDNMAYYGILTEFHLISKIKMELLTACVEMPVDTKKRLYYSNDIKALFFVC